jgi:hypothetical protein
MKRLILYLITLPIVEYIISSIFYPAADMTTKTTQLASINGGDADYVATRATGILLIEPWHTVAFIVITLLFWFGPAKRFFKDIFSENK